MRTSGHLSIPLSLGSGARSMSGSLDTEHVGEHDEIAAGYLALPAHCTLLTMRTRDAPPPKTRAPLRPSRSTTHAIDGGEPGHIGAHYATDAYSCALSTQ